MKVLRLPMWNILTAKYEGEFKIEHDQEIFEVKDFDLMDVQDPKRVLGRLPKSGAINS